MDNIVGHDCDGRPLRSGDKAYLVNLEDEYAILNDTEVTVVGYSGFPIFTIEITTPPNFPDDRSPYTKEKHLRKKHDDHKPADESFDEMMSNLKSGVGVNV